MLNYSSFQYLATHFVAFHDYFPRVNMCVKRTNLHKLNNRPRPTILKCREHRNGHKTLNIQTWQQLATPPVKQVLHRSLKSKVKWWFFSNHSHYGRVILNEHLFRGASRRYALAVAAMRGRWLDMSAGAFGGPERGVTSGERWVPLRVNYRAGALMSVCRRRARAGATTPRTARR